MAKPFFYMSMVVEMAGLFLPSLKFSTGLDVCVPWQLRGGNEVHETQSKSACVDATLQSRHKHGACLRCRDGCIRGKDEKAALPPAFAPSPVYGPKRRVSLQARIRRTGGFSIPYEHEKGIKAIEWL